MSSAVRSALPVVLAALAAGVLASACGRPCRTIETEPVALACGAQALFSGEMHFDDAPTFEDFLSTQCLPGADEATLASIVDGVDFLTDVVFVSSGARAQLGRCIAERSAEEVQVCEGGLRVAFRDVVTDEEPCAGKWTVAFTLPRAEMRAANQD